MKTTKYNSTIALLVVCLAVFFFGTVYSTAADTKPGNKKELKVLLKNAKTPAEHRTIAAYYRQRAEAFSKTSKEHLESAELRAKNPAFPAMEVKHGFAFGPGASHCRFWGSSDAEQARKAEALAVQHEDVALKAELKGANSQQLASVARTTTTFSSMGK
jgi:hypothetical protein